MVTPQRWRGARAIDVGWGALLALASACATEPGEPPPAPEDGALGSDCDASLTCDGDLVCPAGGHLAGQCAVTCTDDSECRIAAGDSYYCFDGVCTRACADTCGFGAVVSRCFTNERCVPQSAIEAGATDCVHWCVP